MFTVMKRSLSLKKHVKVSPESTLSLRLYEFEHRMETKLNLILSLLQSKRPDIPGPVMEDAIRAHLSGDRLPMEQLEKLWEEGLYDPSVVD